MFLRNRGGVRADSGRMVDAGGATGAGPSSAFHDANWVARFHAQATPAMLASVARFAARRARYVAKLGGRTDAVYAAELVADAVADTWLGRVAWDPARCALGVHLCGVVRSRSRHDGARAMLGRDVPELEVASPAPLPDAVVTWAQCLAEVATFADPDVRALVTAYAAGWARRDFLADGWSALRYALARRRLQQETAHWLAVV